MHQLSRHISEQYDAELEIVRRRLMEMGGMVEQQLRDAIKAISTYDAELAAKVSARDHEVNRFEVTLDEQCIHIIARRQPTATDLRLLVTVMKSSTDLERIGDEANRIAKMARELSNLDYQKNLYGETARLGQLATTMVSRALDALARLDTKEALDLIAADKQVDEEYRVGHPDAREFDDRKSGRGRTRPAPDLGRALAGTDRRPREEHLRIRALPRRRQGHPPPAERHVRNAEARLSA